MSFQRTEFGERLDLQKAVVCKHKLFLMATRKYDRCAEKFVNCLSNLKWQIDE